MDKNAIKKYAVWARRELISRVSQRAALYGITEEDCGDPNADSVNGKVLTVSERRQRQALITQIRAKDYGQVMEEVAYECFLLGIHTDKGDVWNVSPLRRAFQLC